MKRSKTEPIHVVSKEKTYQFLKAQSMETESEIHNKIKTPVNSLADEKSFESNSLKTESMNNQAQLFVDKIKESSSLNQSREKNLVQDYETEKGNDTAKENKLLQNKDVGEKCKSTTESANENSNRKENEALIGKIENNLSELSSEKILRAVNAESSYDKNKQSITESGSDNQGNILKSDSKEENNKTRPQEKKPSEIKNTGNNDINDKEVAESDAEKGTGEFLRQDSRVSDKLALAMTYYQEALERRLREASTNEAKTKEQDDDSEKALALWRKAKTTFITKLTKNRKIDDMQDSQEDEKGPKVRFHRWKKTAVSQTRQSAYANRRRSITELQNAMRKKLVMQRFRRFGKLVIFCSRCVQDHCFKYRERSELTPYMQTLNYMDYTADQVSDLMFDRTKFRADRQMRISEETKRILSKGRADRTEQEIYSAQIALRNNRSFSQYPARMQQMMAECGHYEAYEAKRVITREGHPPAAFYFVLSGAVVAMRLDQGRNIASAVAEFVKGDTFEEKPMITDSPRQCTVLTKEPCEFLSISEKDYKNIFMQGGVKTLNDPDQELFLKSLSCFEGWPIKILQEHPTKSRFHYYKRGAILAMDTRQCEWLIIVKSGSLSVLKKLKRVGPYEWRKNLIKPLTEKEKRERQEKKTMWRRFVLPELRLPLRKQNEIDEIEELVDGRPKPFQHPDIKVQFEDDGQEKRGKKYCYPSLWTIKRGIEEEDKATQNFSNINKEYLYLMSSSGNTDQDKSTRHLQKSTTTSGHSKETRKLSTVEERSLSSPSLPVQSVTSSLTATPEPHTDSSLSSLIGSSEFDERIRNIMEDVYSDGRRSPEDFSEMDLNPQFVKVQTLVKSGVWGLADLILEEQTSFTIVSNGADCVLINKQFYLEHASEKLLRKLRHDLCPYPTDEELQQGLQISVDWNDYRQNELSSTMNIVKGKRLMRDVVLGGSAVQDTF